MIFWGARNVQKHVCLQLFPQWPWKESNLGCAWNISLWGGPYPILLPCFHAVSANMFDLLLNCSNIFWPCFFLHIQTSFQILGGSTVGNRWNQGTRKGDISNFWILKLQSHCIQHIAPKLPWWRDVEGGSWGCCSHDKKTESSQINEMFLKLNYCWCFRNLGACSSWGRCNLVLFNLGGSEKFLPWRLPVESSKLKAYKD